MARVKTIKSEKTETIKDKVAKTKTKKPAHTKVILSPEEKAKNKLILSLIKIEENIANANYENDKYMIVDNIEELYNYYMAAVENGILGVDTETSGLHCYDDKLAGLCLYTYGKKAIYVPVGHIDIDGNLIEDNLLLDSVAKSLIRELLEDDRIKHIYHNARFDAKFLYVNFNAKCEVYWDTLIAGYLLNENESHSLKELWGKYCNDDEKATKFNDLFEKIDFRYTKPNQSGLYAAHDAEMTVELYDFQKQYLNEEGRLAKIYKFYKETEMKVLDVVTRMELRGINVDLAHNEISREYYNEISERLNSELNDLFKKLNYDKISKELKSKLSDPINVGSPKQLGIILYDILNLDNDTPDDRRGTSANIIEHLTNKYKGKGLSYEIVSRIGELRVTNKLLTSFIERLPNDISKITNRVHASLNQCGTATGRFSMSNPNLQQIPRNKMVRCNFIPNEGNVFIGADFSQQEPKLLAFVSKDKGLLSALASGRDLYSEVSSIIYHVSYEEALEEFSHEAKDRRIQCKSVILGKMYGRGYKAIAEQFRISDEEALNIVKTFDGAFPGVQAEINKTALFAKQYGYVETVFGRKRRLPDIQLDPKVYSNRNLISRATRQAMNSIIQGSAADMIKRAMIKIDENKRLREIGAFLSLSIHDELIIECPRQYALEAAYILSYELTHSSSEVIPLKFTTDVEITEAWGGDNLLDEECYKNDWLKMIYENDMDWVKGYPIKKERGKELLEMFKNSNNFTI